jgi:hypothetical protein
MEEFTAYGGLRWKGMEIAPVAGSALGSGPVSSRDMATGGGKMEQLQAAVALLVGACDELWDRSPDNPATALLYDAQELVHYAAAMIDGEEPPPTEEARLLLATGVACATGQLTWDDAQALVNRERVAS